VVSCAVMTYINYYIVGLVYIGHHSTGHIPTQKITSAAENIFPMSLNPHDDA